MSESLNTAWGALSLPIPAGDGQSLAGLDPARDILLDLIAAALTSELGAAWSSVAPAELPAPVGDKLPALDDLDTMRQRGAKWPLLSVSRSTEPQQEDEFTLWQNRITCRWTIDYVLGPLEIGNQLKLGDVLGAAGRIIASMLREGGHKAYAETTLVTPTSGPPITAAKRVLGPGAGCCGFSTITVTSFSQGQAAFSQGGPKYHAMTMTLQTTELDTIADEGVTYGGAGMRFGEDVTTPEPGANVELDTAVALQPG